ncbi:9286_t:CDS:2 [Rhizophagus irregularis]|nr:9286_t:CDS:2 [Rhizophagus irregularis]
MDLYVYNLDEYTTDSRQGNEFAPSWPFRLAVAGSSDSDKTTMIINLLMGDKKAKADGEKYILCDTVLLVGRYLDELKWAVAIRENVNYISLHGGHGSLTDTKRIICQYTEESESLAPVIDDLTLQRNFVVFDLRRSKNDLLSIRVRWDTSLSSISIQSPFDPSLNPVRSQFDPILNPVRSQFDLSLNPVRSKFSPYSQKAVAEAKKSFQLIEFARVFPSPKERKHLLVSGVIAKNADTWIKYVFREAYRLSGKTLRSDFQKFLAKVWVEPQRLKFQNLRP